MRLAHVSAVLLLMSGPLPAAASESCTILYRVSAALQVTDTPLGKGDQLIDNLAGSMVLQFRQKRDVVVDGKVKLLHYAMYERFELDSIADIATTLHHYAPRCNGFDDPPWRLPSDAGFPTACRYRGEGRAVAIGDLDRNARKITWAKCKAARNYWAEGDEDYTPAAQSRGRGCLNDMHVVGNIGCDGRLACRMGGLTPGNNPQYAVWNQPLVHGPPGSAATVAISSDLSTIVTPRHRDDGYQSYNLPNDSPSRTWFSFRARRDDSSPHTTCR